MPSVIARLMGLDELSPQQPVQKRQRVLSEKYLQRVSSLGVRENRQSYKCFYRENSELVKEHRIVKALGTQSRRKLYNQWDQRGESSLGSRGLKAELKGLKSTDSRCSLQDESHLRLRKSDNVTEFPMSNGYRSHKLQREVGVTKNIHAPSHSQARKNIGLKSSSVSYSRSCNTWERNEQVKFSRFSRYQLYSKERARQYDTRLLNGSMNLRNTSHILDADWKDKYFGLPRFRPFSAYSTTLRRHIRGRNIVLNRNSHMQHEYYFRKVLPTQDGSQKNCLSQSRSRNKRSQSTHFDTKDYHSSFGTYLMVGGSKIDQEDIYQKSLVASASQNKSSYFMKDDDSSSSQSAGDSFLQDLSNVYSEGGSGLSHYSGSDQESFTSLEGYQPSPDSVLESYSKDDQAARKECLWGVSADPQGLKRHLDLLRSDPSKAYSDGSEVNVSSDEDSGEESIYCSQENRDMMRLFRAEESRDFSYLVDVSNEASFLIKELDQSYNKWHMPDCPISLDIFEALEKKYGGQTCWQRSDRRLLFDRINLGLVAMFMPCMGVPTWTKPVSKRLRRQCKEAIEDELWTLLVKQEREARNALSNKDVEDFDRLLNLGNCVEMIVLELETLLVDELAAEVVVIGRF